MNSNEISQMFASQSAMFMSQNSYAQQIGVAPPSFGSESGGLGTWGGRGRGSPAPFSYSPASTFGGSGGYGAGNRAAAFGMSALGGVASLSAGLALDPFSSFLGGAMGGLARGGIGAAIGGGLVAAAPMLPLAMASQAAIGSVIRGGQQQGAMNTVLGQNFNFVNPMSRTGSGFTRDDSKAIGDQIRSLSHIPEMMTSVEELTRLMPKLKQSGVMQGVHSVSEFQHRFKEAINTIRDMSKILGSTMEEAEQFFAHSRSIGFVGRTAQLKNTLNAQLTAGMTGMDTGQVMQLQSAGAGMAMQFGARRSLGVQAVTNIAQRIGRAQQDGRLRDGLIEDVTGLSGAEGVQAASQKMAQFLIQMSGTAPGRAIMAGAVKFDDSGRAVGLDEGIIKKLNEGRMSIDELKSRGSRLTDAQKISFTARSSDLGASFAGQVDMGRFMQTLVGNKGGDAANLVLQRLTGGQASAQDVDMIMAVGGGTGGSESDLSQMARFKAREVSFKERTDPSAILRRLKTRMHAATFGGLESAGAKIHTEMSKAFESILDDFIGRSAVNITKEGAGAVARAMSGGSQNDLKQMLADVSGLRARARDNKSFRSSDLMSLLVMGPLAGSLTKGASLFRDSDVSAFLLRDGTGTGRSIRSQAEFSKLITGDGLTDDAMSRQGRFLNDGLGISVSPEIAGAKGTVSRVRAEIENFRSMDDERKLVELRSALRLNIIHGMARSRVGGSLLDPEQLLRILQKDGTNRADEYLKSIGIKGGLQEAMRKMETSDDPKARDAANLLRAGMAAQKAGASDILTGVIAATQGKFQNEDMQINISKALRMSGDADITDLIAQSQKDMEASKNKLTTGQWRGGGGLSDTEVAVITSNPETRKVLSDALGDDPQKTKSIRAALAIKDPEVAAKALSRLGYEVKPSDVEAMKSIRDKADGGGRGAIKGALDAYSKGEKYGQVGAVLSAAKIKSEEVRASIEAAAGLDADSRAAAEAVQSALAGMGQGKADSLENLNSSIGNLVEKLRKGGKGTDSLISATGEIGLGVQAAVEGAKSLGKGRITQKKAMEVFGLADTQETREMLERVGIAGGAGSLGVDVIKLTKTVAGFKAAASIAKKNQIETGTLETGEQKLLDSLTKIDNTISQNTAVMTLLANKSGASIDKNRVERAQQALRENNSPP